MNWQGPSGKRFKEYCRMPSPIYDHGNTSGHPISLDHFSIVGTETQNISRTMKEAMDKRVNNPSLNRNIGKLQLPHIWKEFI